MLIRSFGYIRERIRAGVVVENIVTGKHPESKQRGRTEEMSISWRHVVRTDLCALVLPGGHCIEGIRFLEPGTGVEKIEVDRVRRSRLQVETVEPIFLISFGVENLEFGRIKKASSVQSVYGNEISPLCAAKGDICRTRHGAERTVRRGDVAGRFRLSETGPSRDLHYKARLIAVFRRRRAGDDLHGLNRIHGNLIRENLALLICDGLSVHRERILRVIPKAMEKSVGIRDNPR